MNADCPCLITVSLYLDNELSDEEQASALEHFKLCEACRQELEHLEKLR